MKPYVAKLAAVALCGLLSFSRGEARADANLSLYVDPACPTPNEAVTLWATIESGRSSVSADQRDVSVEGNTVRFIVARVDYDEDAPVVFSRHSGVVAVGPLAAGSYRVELLVRSAAPGEAPGPARLEAARELVVQENPPVCGARHIVGKVPQMITASLGQPYSTPLIVEVTDAHGLPVTDARIAMERIAPLDEWLRYPNPRPDVVPVGATMPAAGTYAFTAHANDVAGTFVYRAFLPEVPTQPSAYFVLSNRPGPMTSPLVPVVEYYDYAARRYFMTSSFDEMAKLDRSMHWGRTNGVFLAYAPGIANRPRHASPVCRFYGRPEVGLGAHFFSASVEECKNLAQADENWLLETDDAFSVVLPDRSTGSCPDGTRAIYRAYTNRPDGGHRHTADPGSLNVIEYPSGPWIREGYGPEGVAMCAPE